MPSPPTIPSPPAKTPWFTVQFSTLRLLRDKGIFSQAEYDSALHDIGDTSGAVWGDNTTLVVGKYAATLYGFSELNAIWDSTQSFNDSVGNTQVALPGSYAGGHSRVTFSVRNSRFGIRVKGPESKSFRGSGVLEMDFEGATLPLGAGQPGTEAAYFSSPTFRLRQAYVKFETPVVDILAGQAWHLFGGSGQYLGTSVQVTGVVGQILNRTAQIRLSHTFKSDAVSLEIAVAAVRPPQRNSGVPEGTAGLLLAFPKWTGLQTVSAQGTRIAPLSIALSGDVRNFRVNEFAAAPTTSRTLTGRGFAVDAFIPIVPATKETRGNSLAISGEFVTGRGISNLYSGLTGGISQPPVPNPAAATPAPTYAPDIDPGIAAYHYTPTGGSTGLALSLVQWTTYNLGLQYYLPGLDGRLWISGNYFHSQSSNTRDLAGIAVNAAPAAVTAAQSKVRDHEDMVDVNVFADPYPGVRFGLGYAHLTDTYVATAAPTAANPTPTNVAVNHRVQFSALFLF